MIKRSILQIKDLEKNYYIEGEKGEIIVYEVLKGISFKIEEQDFVAIMGSSGSGKTTLLKVLGMLTDPDQGEILYKGENCKMIEGEELQKIRRQEISFIFQDYRLMDSLTVKENIMLPLILNQDNPVESEEKVEKVAHKFNIGHLLQKKPYELSGGEKQRTAICRAMVVEPDIIFADEPTGNLDSNASLNVIKILEQINKEERKTILVVTHDPRIASFCNKVLFLKDGEIVNNILKKEKKEEFYEEIIEYMKYC